jgi:hypothetical protein
VKGMALALCRQVLSELVESCRNHDFTDIVVVHEHRGEPDGLVVSHLPYGPTAYFGVHNTVCRLIRGSVEAVSLGAGRAMVMQLLSRWMCSGWGEGVSAW